MVDEVRVVKGLRGYGIKEEFAHAKSATAAMGEENVSTLAPLDLYPRPSRDAAPQGVVWSLTRRLCAKCRNVGKGKSWYLSEDFTTLCQMSKCGAGEEGIFCRERFDIMQNVEKCELEKEMDKDGSVVFRVGWTTR